MIEKERLIRMYRTMFTIREFEEKLYYLFLTEPMPGTMHQYIGQEAIAVGVCENLRPDDYITSTHRGHGHCIAKGASLDKMMAEMFAKDTGCCRGMGGSLHLADFSVGMLGAIGIVGAGVPIAAGAGLSAKLRGTNQVVACFFGDGAVNQGAFHEGVNLAAVWRLPVIFVCENNLYGVSTHISKVMLVHDIAVRASAYGIPGEAVDGNDIIQVYESAKKAVDRARNGDGPSLIECKTYRFKGHARFDPAKYRPRKEEEEWFKKDPIPVFKSKLINNRVVTESEILKSEEEVKNEIEKSVKFAKESPEPKPDVFQRYIYE